MVNKPCKQPYRKAQRWPLTAPAPAHSYRERRNHCGSPEVCCSYAASVLILLGFLNTDPCTHTQGLVFMVYTHQTTSSTERPPLHLHSHYLGALWPFFSPGRSRDLGQSQMLSTYGTRQNHTAKSTTRTPATSLAPPIPLTASLLSIPTQTVDERDEKNRIKTESCFFSSSRRPGNKPSAS